MPGFLLDMDGVLYRGAEPIPYAAEFIAALHRNAIPYLLLTNHSCLTPDGFHRKLKKLGLEVPATSIYSSAEATAEWLAVRAVRRAFVIGEEGLSSALAAQGVENHATNVSHVVVGLDRAITYDKLTAAARLIEAGAEFIVTNPDPTYPVENGFAPECGFLLAALENATGKKATVIGKPSPIIYELAADLLGIPIAELTMIGDRLDTDIAGARNAGAKSILVLTGHAKLADLESSDVQPDQIAADLREVKI